ncbi:ABC transporter ATP-binding protein [Sediminivirga luteola]|uniref:ABC transporter ATP-binding protein n=1 Tax=Sediminivirga luteola TaxID=1774748 RepID=A0A8J2TXD4_9MICO|nr:ABC transporter ATP-binding protein [Sediminivirga luteola]MCI2266258.1 ABC transporter ATP-binding protein [Sediminivirga luteola]GGA12148.1 ABC transporter ATP-binding protein [Sediminivirga luteola]
MTAVLEIEHLTKEFQRGDVATVALRDFSLTIEQGTFVTVLGRSGCGKSTMLNLLSGLSKPTNGRVLHRGSPHTGPTPGIGYLTQSDTLMPWRTVQRNVEMPMEIAGRPKPERQAAAAELIATVGLADFADSYPRELSGGMRRRASLARMLANGAETILMDEPFGALDAQLRSELQRELLRLWTATGHTIVFVTHDVEEALLLGDRVVVLGPLGAILLDQEIDLPRPRDPDETKIHPRFVELHATLVRALKEGARR